MSAPEEFCLSRAIQMFALLLLLLLLLLSFLPFQVSSYNKSDCLDFIVNDEWAQFTQHQSTGLLGLGEMLES